MIQLFPSFLFPRSRVPPSRCSHCLPVIIVIICCKLVGRPVLPTHYMGTFTPTPLPPSLPPLVRAALRWRRRRSQVPGYCFPLAKGRARRSGSYCVQSQGWVCVYGEMEIHTVMFPLTPPSPSSIFTTQKHVIRSASSETATPPLTLWPRA